MYSGQKTKKGLSVSVCSTINKYALCCVKRQFLHFLIIRTDEMNDRLSHWSDNKQVVIYFIMINIHIHHTCISRLMANALRRAATQFYFVLLSSAWSKWRFYFITIFIIQPSTRQNMAAAWTEKISRPTRGKLQCNVCALLCSFFLQNAMIWYLVVCLQGIVSPLSWYTHF